MTFLRCVIASDHAGFALKEGLVAYIHQTYPTIDLQDKGPVTEETVNYPVYAQKVAKAIQDKKADRGILICGTGLGMGIQANRFAGVYAIVANEAALVEMGRKHNNANVLCLGARIIDLEKAKDTIDCFFKTPFEGGRHQDRLASMVSFESTKKS